MAIEKKYVETPLMKQYYAVKAVHPDAILLFRVGDFYETFGDDAIKASGILGITLTRRANGAATFVELAGFPYHAIDTYLPKLVRAGERVAICEQLEDPKQVKGLVKRGVIELVTPGVVLGDNIFYGQSFTRMLQEAVQAADQEGKATVFGYWVNDPERYGVAEFDKAGNCLSIEEKPASPKSNYAVVGLYFYPNSVVDVAAHIKPSARGELEITTVNQVYLNERKLKVKTLGRGFAWLDTGTHDSLSEASTFIEVIEKRQGLKVACLEGIAYRQGWISAEKLREVAQPMLKNQYGQYLMRLSEEVFEQE